MGNSKRLRPTSPPPDRALCSFDVRHCLASSKCAVQPLMQAETAVFDVAPAALGHGRASHPGYLKRPSGLLDACVTSYLAENLRLAIGGSLPVDAALEGVSSSAARDPSLKSITKAWLLAAQVQVPRRSPPCATGCRWVRVSHEKRKENRALSEGRQRAEPGRTGVLAGCA